jgi:hypothetical protein
MSETTNPGVNDARTWRSIDPPARLGHVGAYREDEDVTTLPPSTYAEQHFHTDGPLVQVGWIGQTHRVYQIGEDVAATEPGGFSPIYRHWGEKCGHQIQAEDQAHEGIYVQCESVNGVTRERCVLAHAHHGPHGANGAWWTRSSATCTCDYCRGARDRPHQ